MSLAEKPDSGVSTTALPEKIYPFAAYLGDRFGCTTAIHIRPESGAGPSPLREHFQVCEITIGRDRALPPIPGETVDQGLILCTDISVLEPEAAPFLEELKDLLHAARLCILSVPDRASRTSATGPELLDRALRAAGLRPTFVGSASEDGRPRKLVAIIDPCTPVPRRSRTSVTPPADFRVVAIMTAYNEADIIAQSIRRLIAQGVGVYLIDNWSTDSTYDLAAQFLHAGLVGLERFPERGPSPYYDWAALLNRVEALSQELQADWFIHHDADEVRISPWPGIDLREAIYLVDQAGFNCIDHTVLDFHPVDDDFVSGADPEAHFKWFEFGLRYDHFQQVKAWKNFRLPIALAELGGHDVSFPGRRVYPYKFLLKHYSIRSQAHGERKVFQDRRPRWRPDERAKGWHVHYDTIQQGHLFRRLPSELEYFDDASFFDTYLIERLSGVGLGQQAEEVKRAVGIPSSFSTWELEDELVRLRSALATAEERTQAAELQAMAQADELLRLRAELGTANEKLQEIELEAARIVGSHTWQLLIRLETLRRRELVDRLARAIRVAQTQGLDGFLASVVYRFWQPRPAPLAPITPAVPDRLPQIHIAQMTDPVGVTIVMRVSNRTALACQCLKSVVDHTVQGSYEVIAVADDPADETLALLEQVDGLQVIRREEGRSFLEGYNLAASRARGAFLLFLNEDIVVPDDGWLDELRETMQRDPTIGAAGPQILDPDGRLQEAGAIMWSDGIRLGYGQGDDPIRPEYQYLRDVDSCAGACLLVRRELFDRLGGFDPQFAPGSYEDADLCFGLQRLGHRAVYQPKARVVRVTGGTDAAALPQREIFVRKHREALAGRRSPAPEAIPRARDCRPGKRILVVDHRVPHYDVDSGAVRCLAILRILCDLGHKVTFVGDDRELPEPYTGTLRQIGVEVLGKPLSIALYIEQHLAEFDVVILCRAPVATKYLPPIVARRNRPSLILDTVDLHFLREWRQAELARDPTLASVAALTRSVELSLIRQSDLTWVVSQFEADLLEREAPTARVEIVTNVHTVRPVVPPFETRRDLVFVGGFQHSPNVDAVLHFVQDIFPMIKRHIPDIRFRVIGPDAPSAIRGLASPDVEIAGHVRDIDPILDSARVSVAPLRYGAGMKGKIGQSLAYGLPVVTTRIGAEGMSLRKREHVLIADHPQDFAAAVVEIYLDSALWTRLSEQGRRHVDALFGYDAVKAKLDTIIRKL